MTPHADRFRRFGTRLRLHGRRFAADARGAIAIAAAGILPVILLLAFGAVEFHRYTSARSLLQDALDAAGLAVARSSSQDAAALQQLGEAVLRSRVPFDENLRLVSFTVTYVNGVFVTNAEVEVEPIISSIFLEGDLALSARSEVTREAVRMDIALVLDTTWSMLTNDRIGVAKEAAADFVTQISTAAAAAGGPSDNVRIGLVPFNSAVNVGSAHAGASWMDTAAQSPVHVEIFSRRADPHVTVGRSPTLTYPAEAWATRPNRFTLLQQMGVAWGGCVESRPFPHDVEDTPATAAQPETLFVPYFYPDEPDRVTANDDPWYNASLPRFDLQTHAYPNSYLEDLRRTMRGYTSSNGLVGAPWRTATAPEAFNVSGYSSTLAALTDFRRYVGGGDAADPSFHRGVQGVVDKYAGVTTPDVSGNRGPNRECLVRPIVPPTSAYGEVQSAIQALTVNSYTNIPLGLVWGWHLVSPHSPYGGGRPYGRGNTKIVVLMTDGDNWLPGADDGEDGSGTGNQNGTEYSSVGYPWQNRLGTTSTDSAVRSEALNTRMAALCANMNAAGVILYTVRVEVTGTPPDLLRNCATDPDKFFDVRQASDLTDAFDKIADSISKLRIAK